MFAFAVTLLVVSLEVPKTFVELREMMRGFVGFGLCFVLLLLIWHQQYLYFRRYALDDGTSFALNAALLFVVAFYIYPLKFLFTALVDQVTGHRVLQNGMPVPRMRGNEWVQLMLIYGAGFVGLYVIFALLYLHAYRQRDALELTATEAFDTRSEIVGNVCMIGIGVLSMTLAWLRTPSLAGMTYMLIAPLRATLGAWNGRRRRLGESVSR